MCMAYSSLSDLTLRFEMGWPLPCLGTQSPVSRAHSFTGLASLAPPPASSRSCVGNGNRLSKCARSSRWKCTARAGARAQAPEQLRWPAPTPWWGGRAACRPALGSEGTGPGSRLLRSAHSVPSGSSHVFRNPLPRGAGSWQCGRRPTRARSSSGRAWIPGRTSVPLRPTPHPNLGCLEWGVWKVVRDGTHLNPPGVLCV